MRDMLIGLFKGLEGESEKKERDCRERKERYYCKAMFFGYLRNQVIETTASAIIQHRNERTLFGL